MKRRLFQTFISISGLYFRFQMLLFKVDYYNTERGYDFLKIYNSQTEVARLDG